MPTTAPQRHARPKTQTVHILDMASLRYRTDGHGSVVVCGVSGELLAVVAVPQDTSAQELVFQAMEHLLTAGSVPRPDPQGVVQMYRVGLYNPYTAEVVIGGAAKATVYCAPGGVALEPDGTRATVTARGLEIGDSCLEVAVPLGGLSDLRDVYAAHRP